MTNEVRLTPVTRSFARDGVPRGMYSRLIKQFLNSGEVEMNVEAANLKNAYLGLRSTVSNMGLRGRVYVQQSGGEVHLIRRG